MLTSITKAYESELLAYRAMGDEHMTQAVVLGQLGILTFPEIFEFCGDIRLGFSGGYIATGAFHSGFCLQSENLRELRNIDAPGIKTMLFVENRTNYRWLVMQGVSKDTLLVYHGGFYSPAKRRLFELLSTGAPTAAVLFWGDIDLGGFLMFTRLKNELFPALTAWKMGMEEYASYQSYGVTRSTGYLNSLRGKLEKAAFDAAFFPVARVILESGVTVEQEIML
jgi:hypothetical protein